MQSIKIIYEDSYLLIIDKPAGVTVHEGAGHSSGNDPKGDRSGREGMGDSLLLTDWLKANRSEIVEAFKDEDDTYFRPGIVHRLDKDTSGLLIIAKTVAIKKKLQAMFKSREVIKQYLTLVLGRSEPKEGTIHSFIGRDPNHRRQMTVSYLGNGREAITQYQTEQIYKLNRQDLSLLTITLKTGRMHQIRVHLKYKGWPVIGDQTYQTKLGRNISRKLNLTRQFLHAKRLDFKHPETGERLEVVSPLPLDLTKIIERLEVD